MKFSEHVPVKDSQGDMRVCDGQVLVGTVDAPCLVCGEPTRFVDISSEARFCSDECMNKFYERLYENEEARVVEDV